MFIVKQKDLICYIAPTFEEANKMTQSIDNYVIEETDKTYILYEGNYLTPEEVKAKEKEKVQLLSMTPLDFIKALEKFAGISYEQIKALCNTYPSIDRELRFCQNVYRNNPMLSQESLAQLPEVFRLTAEQVDNLFIEVNKLKVDNSNNI